MQQHMEVCIHFLILFTCFKRFGIPFPEPQGSLCFRSAFATPPLYFRARTVATITTAFGFQTSHTTFDIKEFLCSKVCTESGFCDRIISKLQRHLGSGYGVTSVSNVCERSAVYDSQVLMLQCLNKVSVSEHLFRSAVIAPSA